MERADGMRRVGYDEGRLQPLESGGRLDESASTRARVLAVGNAGNCEPVSHVRRGIEGVDRFVDGGGINLR